MGKRSDADELKLYSMDSNTGFNSLFLRDQVFISEIDIFGHTARYLSKSQQLHGYMFVLCVRGEIVVNVLNNTYTMRENCVLTVLPNFLVSVESQSPDCRLFILAFDQRILNDAHVFSNLVNCVPFVFESPVIEITKKAANIVRDYILVLIRAKGVRDFVENKEFVGTLLHSFIYGLGSSYKISCNQVVSGGRSKDIVRRLVQQVIIHYKQERSPMFYADKLHITPQHLSATVSKVTGKRVTDVIAQLVIVDAQSKLKSTDLSIQEIAYSLNFPNVSFFGKYFKRYTGLSPRAFRESDFWK